MNYGILKFIQASADAASSAAENSAANGSGGGSWLSMLSPLFMIVVFGAVFYLFVLRPEKKRKKAAEEQREALRVGNTIITIGGITGEVERVGKETITIFTGKGSIDVQKWAIREVLPSVDEDTEEDGEAE